MSSRSSSPTTRPYDIRYLPNYTFDLLLRRHEEEPDEWFLKWRDPTWELPSVLSPAQESPHAELFIDHASDVGNLAMSALPVFETNMALLSFIAGTNNEVELALATTLLVKRLRERLKPYFHKFRKLQGVLRLSKAIITGSFIVSFLHDDPTNPDAPEIWHPGDIDVIVMPSQDDRGLKIMLSFIVQSGYRLVGDSISAYNKQGFAGHVYRFVNSADRVVEVVDCHMLNPVAYMRYFHSSIVRNGMSSQNLLVMFPEWTGEKKSLAPEDLPLDIKEKYESRGISFVHTNTAMAQPCGTRCPALVRSISRLGTCLLVPLSTTWQRAPDPEFPALEEWTSGVQCTNPFCSNCHAPAQLREAMAPMDHAL